MQSVAEEMMISNYVKTALRNIRKYRSYSLINLIGLALAMISCIYIMLWVQSELAFDRFHQHYDRLYRFVVKMNDGWHESNPLALVPTLRETFPDIQQMTRFSKKRYNVRSGGINFAETGALIDRDFFTMFSFPLVTGEVSHNFSDSHTILITQRLARKFFPNENPIGRPLIIENNKRFTITGVLKNVPQNSHIQFDFLLPIRQMRDRVDSDWSYDCRTYLTLKDTVNLSDFQNKIAHVITDNNPMDWKVLLKAQPFGKIHLYALNGTNPIIYIYIFIGLALVILFIACVNFVNLSNSLSVFRAKEIALRRVAGAKKRDIVTQFVGEAILVSLTALIFSIIATLVLLPLLNQLSEKQIVFTDFFNLTNIVGAISLAVLAGILCAIYPALLLSSIPPAQTVRGRIQYRESSKILRRIFLSTQFIITIILIIATLAMYRQLHFIWNMDLGLNKDQVISIPMNTQLWSNFSPFKNSLMQNTGIVNVTSAYNHPTNIFHTNLIDWQGNDTGKPISIMDQSVDYDYFALFGMKFVKGRSFSRNFLSDEKGFILNEAALKLIGYKNPIGKTITLWKTEGPIIGIVKDFHSSPIHQKIKPTVFMLSERHGPRTKIFVKLKSDRIPETLQFIRGKAVKFAPNHRFEFTFLNEFFARQYLNDQRISSLYRIFAFLAVVISCLGLYGLVSSAVNGRMKEIGIRKILGSTITRIVTLLSKEFIILICLSTLIAWPLSYWIIKRIFDNYAYKVGIGIFIYLVSLVIILCLALLTVGSKIFRAAYSNPVDSLRSD
jgi:ABC-type antimicrobial peptide transport system permease subunit